MANNYSFPNQIASREEKSQDTYGLKYAQAIWGEYTNNAVAVDRRRNRLINNRKYAEGLESIDKYKNRLDIDGDTSYLNLDFSPVNRIATLVDNMVGMLMNQDYKIQCDPIDSESKTKYDNYRKQVYANLRLKQIAPRIEEKTGIPLIPTGQYVPEDNDEAEIHLKLNYKMDAAIAMEEALTFVADNNVFGETRRKILRDLIVINTAALERYYDSNYNIIHEYVDPIDLITPYSKTEDYKNIAYYGIRKQYQIFEIAEMNPEFTEQQLFDIAKNYAGQNNNSFWNDSWGQSYEGYYANDGAIRPYNNFNITVLKFQFLTTNTDKRVKKKNSKGGYYYDKAGSNYSIEVSPEKINVIDKGDEWQVVGESLFVSKAEVNTIEDAKVYFSKIKTERRKSKIEVNEVTAKYKYEGYYIPCTDYVWNYKMVENIERERVNGSYTPETELGISIITPNMYDMENKSLVERLIPMEDGMNIANLKVQQSLIKAVPPGIKFDIEGTDGIILENGKEATPLQLLRVYQQTGSIPFSSKGKDGAPINSAVIERLQNGVGNELNAFMLVINHYQQMMNDVIGFNSAVDGSSPNSNALVGVQKMAASATYNALRPLLNASNELIIRSTRRIALMIQDSMRYNTEAFTMAIGEQATNTLKYGRKLAFNQFAIMIRMLPDAEEQMELTNLLMESVRNKQLTSSDVIRVKQQMKTDTKLAAQLMVLLENKNKKEAQKQSMELQKQNGDIQVQSAQASKKAETEAMTMIEKAKQETLMLEYRLKAELARVEIEGEKEVQILKNQGTLNVASTAKAGKEESEMIKHHSKILQNSQAKESEKEDD